MRQHDISSRWVEVVRRAKPWVTRCSRRRTARKPGWCVARAAQRNKAAEVWSRSKPCGSTRRSTGGSRPSSSRGSLLPLVSSSPVESQLDPNCTQTRHSLRKLPKFPNTKHWNSAPCRGPTMTSTCTRNTYIAQQLSPSVKTSRRLKYWSASSQQILLSWKHTKLTEQV